MAVARPDRSETMAIEPAPMVPEVKLRVPYVQTSEAVKLPPPPPVIVRVEAYVSFQTSAAKAPKVESVLPEVVQTSAAVIL